MIVDIQEKRLGIEPLAQAMLLQTPTPGCIIMASWTVERWDILSSELSPGNPCSLAQKWKCIIEQNLDKYAAIICPVDILWQLWEMVSSNQSALCLHHRGVDSWGLTTGKLGGCTGSQDSMGHLRPRWWGQPGRCSRTRGRRRPPWREAPTSACPRRSAWTGRAPWYQCSHSSGAGSSCPSRSSLKPSKKNIKLVEV